MKTYIQNRCLIFVVFLICLLLKVETGCAQDSLYQERLQENISALDKLYCPSNLEFLLGEFEVDTVVLEEEFQKLKLFTKPQKNASTYFNYFNQLPQTDKNQIVQLFAYYESNFDTQFKEAQLSPDLKYLALALSAMNMNAVDDKKCAGIWQLNHFQGVLNGLQINRLVDERFVPQKATMAFVQQLKLNEELFGSQELAVLAYLVGNVKLKNTIARCGENPHLAEVLNKLPEQVSETIASFQAWFVFFQQNKFLSTQKTVELDTVSINRQVHFKQIAQVLNIPEEQLQFLNPQYRYAIIPGDKKVSELILPDKKYDKFMMMSDSVYHAFDSSLFEVITQKIEYAPAPNRQYVGEKVKDLEIEGKTKLKYTIQSGDVLGFIAEDYDVRVADLKYWNNIYNERKIQAGKTLDIFVDNEKADYYRSLQPEKKQLAKKTNPIVIPKNARKVQHTVKSGESPYLIAKKYNGVTPEAILAWNGISDARKIQIGQKLIIYLAQ